MPAPVKNPNALRRNREHCRERLAKWRAEHPEQHAETVRRNQASRADRYRKNPAYYLWRTARHRAKCNGQPFDIEPEDLVIPELCPITGEQIDVLTSNYQTGASVDRVINDLGYVKGNVRIISRKANRIKGDATIEQLERVIAYMRGDI